MQFTKFHGYGNDYIVIETNRLASIIDLNSFVQRICNRHYGAGADGVVTIDRSNEEDSDFTMRIFNADGGEAAMSGNGSRCAVGYLYYKGLWEKHELRLNTLAGIKHYRLRETIQSGHYRFEAELGKPLFDNQSIPMKTKLPLPYVLGYPLSVGEQTVQITALQMCNPNCCIFVEDSFDELDWRALGKAIERHDQFPERTNVEFIRVKDRSSIEVRIWERGVGETFSSGTGASAAAVASMINELTDRRVKVETLGGELEVDWRADGEVLLTGEAQIVYSGEWLAL
jgi:diaminopimelate epimerase